MKSVLISVRPEWCKKIAIGKKTIETRKTRPKLDTPFKCYIYCTQGDKLSIFGFDKKIIGNGKVIGEFVCDKIDVMRHTGFCINDIQLSIMLNPYGYGGTEAITSEILNKMCLTYDELEDYSKGGDLYGWHISDLVIYDEPKELSEFKHYCDKKNTDKCNRACKNFWYDEIWDGQEEYVFAECNNEVKKPPQSWCYVKE